MVKDTVRRFRILGTRLNLAITDLMETLRGDRLAIVTFAGNSAIKCPLTQDYAFVRMALAVWDGAAGARDGLKAVSIWHDLKLSE